MSLFGSKKKEVVDWTAYRKKEIENRSKQIQSKNLSAPQTSKQETPFGFFGAIANTVSSQQTENNNSDISEGSDDKRKKLAKRLIDMTEKLEEISNQIYHLQQRLEVVERKLDVNRF